MTDLTDLQQAILHTKREDPALSNREIASRVGCSPSYVSQTLNDHGGWELDQMAGDPVTADDIERDYTPPHEREDSGGKLLALLLLLLVLWYLVQNGAI